MENLPTNLCFEREGTTNQEGVPITIDLWSIFNEFPSLNFATVYVKVDYVIFPHAENTFWFYIESPHVIAPDKKPYTLAAAKKQAPEVVVLTNTAATGDSFSSCHRMSHKTSHLSFKIFNLINREPLNTLWSIKVTLIIPQQ
jgi:hypothetical protein